MVSEAQAPPEPDGCHLHFAHANCRRKVCTDLHALQYDHVDAAMEASSPAWQVSWSRPKIMQEIQQINWQDRHQSPAG